MNQIIRVQSASFNSLFAFGYRGDVSFVTLLVSLLKCFSIAQGGVGGLSNCPERRAGPVPAEAEASALPWPLCRE